MPFVRDASAAAAVMQLAGILCVFFCILTKHLVGKPFLLVGHRVIEIFESRDELLHVLGVCGRDLLVGLHVLQRIHRLDLLRALHQYLVPVSYTHLTLPTTPYV